MKRSWSTPAFVVMCALNCHAQLAPSELPASIASGKQGVFHVQGIAVDESHGFVYFSFTDKLIKTDLSGNIVGSVTGLAGHLGDLAFDPEANTIYGSLEFKDDEVGKGINKRLGLEKRISNEFYIAIFDGARIVSVNIDANNSDLLKTAYLREVVDDYEATVNAGDRTVRHRFGCSGIDGVALGPSIGDTKDKKKYVYVAYGIYGDTTRNDNDNQVILKYDVANLNALARKPSREHSHLSGPESPLAKYFVRTGNTAYGIQSLAYDGYSGNFFAAVYRGTKSQFPNYDLFIIDGRTKPHPAQIVSDHKTTTVEALSLLDAGLNDPETGVRGWNFRWGSTGLFPLGHGMFYVSHNEKADDGQQSATIRKYKWIGSDNEPFVLVK